MIKLAMQTGFFPDCIVHQRESRRAQQRNDFDGPDSWWHRYQLTHQLWHQLWNHC